MSIKFSEINKDGPRKSQKQILEEITRTLRPKNMNRAYFYDGEAKGDMAHFALEQEAAYLDSFEDVPF